MSSSKVGVTYYVRGYTDTGEWVEDISCGNDWLLATKTYREVNWDKLEVKLERTVHNHRVLKKRKP